MALRSWSRRTLLNQLSHTDRADKTCADALRSRGCQLKARREPIRPSAKRPLRISARCPAQPEQSPSALSLWPCLVTHPVHHQSSIPEHTPTLPAHANANPDYHCLLSFPPALSSSTAPSLKSQRASARHGPSPPPLCSQRQRHRVAEHARDPKIAPKHPTSHVHPTKLFLLVLVLCQPDVP
jgi:hypothetical protein